MYGTRSRAAKQKERSGLGEEAKKRHQQPKALRHTAFEQNGADKKINKKMLACSVP